MPLGTSRAAAFADYDDDGDVDVAVYDSHSTLKLFENVAPKHGSWIGLCVLDARGASAVGAVVRLETAGAVRQRACHAAYSYAAAHDPRVHFGLAPGVEECRAVVVWPDGASERFGSLTPGRYHTLRRGDGH